MVSGFGFRVSQFETTQSGFRVSVGPGEVKSSESVSGFGFRVSGPMVSGFGFRVSVGPGEVKSSEFSGFAVPSVSGFGFRWSKPTLQTSLRITSQGIRCIHIGTDIKNHSHPASPGKQ